MNTNKNKPLERIIREFGVKNGDCQTLANQFDRIQTKLPKLNL